MSLTCICNPANRLSAVGGANYAYQYVYNCLGDREQSLLDGTATTFTLDINTGLTQVLADGANTTCMGSIASARARPKPVVTSWGMR